MAGLVAQLVDGALGMGYGVTSSTLLLAGGLGPAAASAAVHFSEIGTSLVSGISHHTLGNTDWRVVGVLAVPGFVGAFAGATFLVSLDAEVAVPVVAGLLDAVGGVGWGPVGTTTLLSSGRLEPRKVIGSVDTAEFVVSVGGSLGFLVALGSQGVNWAFVGALMVGGGLAAPIAALVVRHLPARVLGVSAGGLIVLTILNTLAHYLGASGVTVGLLASVVFTTWVLWVAWAVKLEQA